MSRSKKATLGPRLLICLAGLLCVFPALFATKQFLAAWMLAIVAEPQETSAVKEQALIAAVSFAPHVARVREMHYSQPQTKRLGLKHSNRMNTHIRYLPAWSYAWLDLARNESESPKRQFNAVINAHRMGPNEPLVSLRMAQHGLVRWELLDENERIWVRESVLRVLSGPYYETFLQNLKSGAIQQRYCASVARPEDDKLCQQ